MNWLLRRSLLFALVSVAAVAISVPASAKWTVPSLRSAHSAVAAQALPAARAHAVRRAADGSLPAHGCIMATDPAGNAAGTVSPALGNIDSLDITAIGFATDTKAGTLSAQLKVVSLSDGPNGGPMMDGTVDHWQVKLTTPDGHAYVLAALYGAGGSVSDTSAGPGGVFVPSPSSNVQYMTTFFWGDANNSVIGQGTGSLDATTNVVTITVPLSGFKSLNVGDKLVGLQGHTFAVDAGSDFWPNYGYLYEDINTVDVQDAGGNDIPYAVGTAC